MNNDLINHVGCGSLDEHGLCDKCSDIRRIIMSHALAEPIQQGASAYFDKGRCSGHVQFNGRYCRDMAGPERWCIHCAGFMLMTRLAQAEQEIATLKRQLHHEGVEHSEEQERLIRAQAEIATLKAEKEKWLQ